MTVAERFAFAPLAVFVLCAAINSVGLLFGIPVGAYSMIIAFAAVALYGALRDRRMCFAACAAAVLMAVTAPVFANIWDFPMTECISIRRRRIRWQTAGIRSP